ncbi:zinc ribbon domain-containing protein [Psychrobacter fozii]|uniref:Double zinc ribbon protein n=1 Tax=Psychrobacter fozii TaxID=198480 RepID=A0A2V4UR33_9GAMM|nr:zinc ribbon domain-containing protein [Psychrobacter fozii]PYE38996.1 double zinc ribbon protein [Psychrobacter fozii]
MALINCPECTHKISDQSVTCTSCGLPTSKMRFSIKCPECSKSISNQSISCTNCGFPLIKSETSKDIPLSPEELKELKLLKELKEAGEHDEQGFFDNTTMFIISCIIIYFLAKEDIHKILQHVMVYF